MKTSTLLKLLPLTTLLLTGCDITIKKEEFLNKLEEVNQALSFENKKLDDVHINSKIAYDVFNYKKNQYYGYRSGWILAHGEYSWKDGDTYWHYVDEIGTGHDKKTEIDESTFNVYMLAHMSTLLSQLRKPYNIAKQLAEEDVLDVTILGVSTYYVISSYNNKLTTNSGRLKIASTVNFTYIPEYEPIESDYSSETIVIEFSKDHLPTKITTEKKDRKGDKTKDSWSYSYGNSKFSDPTASDTSEQA